MPRSTWLMGGASCRSGAIAIAVAMLNAMRIRGETSWLPNIGTIMKKPLTRKKFQTKWEKPARN